MPITASSFAGPGLLPGNAPSMAFMACMIAGNRLSINVNVCIIFLRELVRSEMVALCVQTDSEHTSNYGVTGAEDATVTSESGAAIATELSTGVAVVGAVAAAGAETGAGAA